MKDRRRRRGREGGPGVSFTDRAAAARRLRVLLAVMAGLAAPACEGAVMAHGDTPLKVVRISLHPDNPARRAVGALTFLGGLNLTSTDRRFGGFSGLRVSADGTALTAVSDRGYWLTARLTYDRNGWLAGAAEAQMASLRTPRGVPLAGRMRDAEALTRLGDDSWLVAFEQKHRLWRYPRAGVPASARAAPFWTPPADAKLPRNGGFEAITALAGGEILAVSEYARNAGGDLRGWIIADNGAKEFAYATSGDYSPTDFALLPNGDVLVLERRFGYFTGFGARLRRLRAADIRPGARLDGRVLAVIGGSLVAANFEGLSVRRLGDGTVLVYLLSDDNYRAFQRTLLLMFQLD